MTIANTLYVPSNDFIVEAFHVDGGPLPLNGKWLTIVRMGFTGHFVYDLRSNKYRKKSESRKTFGAALASLHDAEKLENSLVTGMRMSGFVAGPPVGVPGPLGKLVDDMLIHDFKYQFGAVGPPECPNPRLRLDFTGQWMRNVNAAGSFAQFRNQGVLFTRDVSFFVFRLHPEIEQLRNEPGIGDWNSAAS